MSSVTIEQANAQLQPTMAGLAGGEVYFPVCVFYFTVKEDKGYCTWGHEPVVEKGQARLRTRTEADCHPLDDKALAAVVSCVNAWYDALSASLKG